MVFAEIITIGDELLIGQVIDTNSAWIAKELNIIGIKVKQISSISDDPIHIRKALDEAKQRASVIILTGGLGPTNDDITKNTLCEYFNVGLKFDEPSFKMIETIFHSRGREVSEINRLQAAVPENCTALLNKLGTAPGMYFDVSGTIFISLPGVPYEMKGLMKSEVLPRLADHFSLPPVVHRTILTQGIGESMIAEKLVDWEANLPKHLKLAYLPSTGMVRLRISGTATNDILLKEEIAKYSRSLETILAEYIYGFDDDTLEKITGKLLRQNKKTVSTAESCTGGYIAHRITSIPGSSEYYKGSIVAYANEIKLHELNVDMNLLEEYGAVSEEVVKAMARTSLRKFHSDYAIACSGIAGPDGGTTEKPVGTVWLAVASFDKMVTRKLQLGKHRERVIMETSLHALNTLRKMLLEE